MTEQHQEVSLHGPAEVPTPKPWDASNLEKYTNERAELILTESFLAAQLNSVQSRIIELDSIIGGQLALVEPITIPPLKYSPKGLIRGFGNLRGR